MRRLASANRLRAAAWFEALWTDRRDRRSVRCQYHEDECAAERGGSYQRVKGKTDGEIERQPWQVEQGGGAGARQYRPYRIESRTGCSPSPLPRVRRQAYHQLVNTVAEPPVDLVSDPDQHAAPGNLQDALEDEKQRGNDTQPDEGRHAATRQDAIIHFQHEQRAGQAQEVDQSAEGGNADQCGATRRKRTAQFRPGLVGRRGMAHLHG